MTEKTEKTEKTEMTWLDTFRRERRAGTPIIVVVTPDQPAAARAIAVACNGKTPCVLWSMSTGLAAANDPGAQVVQLMLDRLQGPTDPAMIQVMVDALAGFRAAPERSILVCSQAQLSWSTPAARDALLSLRDVLKQDGRSLVLLAPDAGDLAREVASDVRVIREELPRFAARRSVIASVYDDASSDPANGLPPVSDETLDEAARATAGLTAFAVEQAAACAITRSGLDLSALRASARETVNATRGLRMESPVITFADAAGVDAFAAYARGLFRGPARPAAVVLLDEIEKMLAGSAGGDLSGVSSDMLGALLTWMESREVHGTLLMGPPGSGKSLCAQAAAGEHGVPLIWMDIGGMKGSLVGESGQNLRRALDTIDAVSEGRVLLVATCNGVAELKPELLRRFKPRFMVDLPTADTLPAIWDIQMRRHGIDPEAARPDATGWTGAEVRDACRLARDLAMTPADAASYIVPISVSAASTIAKVRSEAAGRFVDAARGGPYRGPDAAPATPAAPVARPGRRGIRVQDI